MPQNTIVALGILAALGIVGACAVWFATRPRRGRIALTEADAAILDEIVESRLVRIYDEDLEGVAKRIRASLPNGEV